jgi:hypothetical protein
MRALIEIAKVLPPLTNFFSSNKVIHFKEAGTTGFGDRLRGISLLLFLSKFYKIDCFCYEEVSSDAFPWSITDLIEIDGIRFIQSEDSRSHSCFLKVIHNSAKGTIIKRLGYEGMKRLRPKSTVVKAKIDSMPLGAHCIGVHIRTTDSVHANHSSSGAKDTTERMITAINNLSTLNGYSHAYLACDSLEARDTWSDIIAANSNLQIIHNSASFDRYQLRQTSSEDMITDFFALSRCGFMLRSVPSEFSRFAALAGGLKMKYNQLEGKLS